MTDLATLRRGRKSFEQRAWSDAHRLLTAADRDGVLEPEDLDRAATAAYLLGRDDESEALRARAHQAFVNRGDLEGAARAAGWLAFGLLQRGAAAPASGWLARAARIPTGTARLRGARISAILRHSMRRAGRRGRGHAAFSQAPNRFPLRRSIWHRWRVTDAAAPSFNSDTRRVSRCWMKQWSR
jgi:hypothetical protein